MTPLERAARAAQIAHHGWSPETKSDTWALWIPAVRAALQAIREPGGLAGAGADAIEAAPMDADDTYLAEVAWPAMIDAALDAELALAPPVEPSHPPGGFQNKVVR